MQALLLNNGLAYSPNTPTPVAEKDCALIRMKLAGICATDLELVKGYAGFSGIPGHEFVGIVEAVSNPEHQHWLNKRVVGSINIGCHQCEACLAGNITHCQKRTVLGIHGKNGVFADYFTLPVHNLYAVPEQVSDELAVFAEPLAAAIRVLEQLHSREVATVAVVGPGRLGLLIAKVLALAGYQVEVLGRSETSLILPRQWQLKAAMVQDIPDNSYACVVDATGQASGFRQALRIIKPCGVLILKSTFSSQETIDLTKVVVGEIHILGSRCGPFNQALSWLSRQSIPLETLIDGRYNLVEGMKAFAQAAQPGVRKILLEP